MDKPGKPGHRGNVLEERRGSAEERRDRDRILTMLTAGNPIPTFAIDKKHRVIYWNRPMEVLSGITADRAVSSTVAPWKAFYKDKRPCLADLLIQERTGEIEQWYPNRSQKSTLLECAYEATDFFPALGNEGRWLRCTAALLRKPSGSIFGAIETLEDVTDQVQAEEALKKSEALLTAILQRSPIPTFVIDKNRRILYWNGALEEISRIKAADVLGTRNQWKAFYGHERPCMADLLVDERLDDLPLWYGQSYSRSTLIDEAFEGTDFFPALGEKGKWLRFTAAILRDSGGNLLGAQETLEDITARVLAEEALKASEKKYKTLSITDGLTKLFNGRHFYKQIRSEMDRAVRYGHNLSLLFFDIDDFKNYNDAFGHLEGDEVLTRLAEVTQRCLRKTDSAYRFGGEEFTAILPETSGTEATVIADRIRREFGGERFYPGQNEERKVTVSIGIAQYDREENLSELIRRADMNMYQAKSLGKNQVVFT